MMTPTAKVHGKKPRKPLSNAERQQRFREKRAAHLRELEQLALRNGKPVQTAALLRNDATRRSNETTDETLVRLRQAGDRLAAAYIALIPSLTAAEIETARSRWIGWRKRFDDEVLLTRVSRTKRGADRRAGVRRIA